MSPTPSDNWNTVTVRGSFYGVDGRPIAGKVSFTLTASRLFDMTTPRTIIGRPVVVTLVEGAFSVALPATDDPDILPEGAKSYTVQEHFDGGATYSILVPLADAADGIDLTTTAQVPTIPTNERDTFIQQVTDAAGGGGVGGGGIPGSGVTAIVALTRVEYGALTLPDPQTLYIVTES